MRRHFGLKDHGPTLEDGILAHLCGTPSDFHPGKAKAARPDSATRTTPGEGISEEDAGIHEEKGVQILNEQREG